MYITKYVKVSKVIITVLARACLKHEQALLKDVSFVLRLAVFFLLHLLENVPK